MERGGALGVQLGERLATEFFHRPAAVRHRAADFSLVRAIVIVGVFGFAVAESECAATGIADHRNILDAP